MVLSRLKLNYLLGFILIISMSSCFSEVEQNEEGFIYNSWSGEDSNDKIYSGGTHSHGWYDEMFCHTLETQSKTYEANVLSKNGLNVGIKMTINWKNNPGTVATHYSKYQLNGEGRFIDPTVYGTLKDVVGKYLPEEIYSTKREQIEGDIVTSVNEKFESSSLFTLELVEILDINLPNNIVLAIERKVQEEQTTLEEEQKAKTAEAKGLSRIANEQADVETAKLKAEQNRYISNSITPQIIRMKELELEELRLKRWNGKYPNVMAGGNSGLLLDVSGQ